MDQPPTTHGQTNLVSKILQVALGLFVTTAELPAVSNSNKSISLDCSFDTDCRWISFGGNVDRWRIARGEPDSLLWLAATGTMQIPHEPYALIESRGNPVDALITDEIRCQFGLANLSFTFWVIGNADIEICLIDVYGVKFNCTGKLNSSIMPGRVSLKIPELQRPFKIMIQPSSAPGVIILDDIRFDSSHCNLELTHETNQRGRPDFMTTLPPQKIRPWTMKKTPENSKTISQVRSTETPLLLLTTTQSNVTIANSAKKFITTTEMPFDILIIGNKTIPLTDQRTGTIIKDTTQLLCDFNNEFPCRWGPGDGRWAIIQKGAIPSLEDSVSDPTLLPTYPASLVLQGTAMLSSDPIECQSGNAKVLFRYWSNGDILLHVCAFENGNISRTINCFEQSKSIKHDKSSLAVFEMNQDIDVVFTLNIVPQWETGLRNKYLVIDEIAYIGRCNSKTNVKESLPNSNSVLNSKKLETRKHGIESVIVFPNTNLSSIDTDVTKDNNIKQPVTQNEKKHKQTTLKLSAKKKNLLTTYAPIYPENEITNPMNSRGDSKKLNAQFTTSEPKQDNYCDLLNCSFDDTACFYLNHGLTKKPWTLRNRGYGYPLTGTTDIRISQANGQFVSAILEAGDIAILESPKFNATSSLNVLLFQYFRPSQMTTIRICLGSQYTSPLRTISSFVNCPSILRSVTSKNAFRWNTVHIQLPPGTTHFYLVAHSNNKSGTRAAIAIDNIRVAICDTREFAPDYVDETADFQHFSES